MTDSAVTAHVFTPLLGVSGGMRTFTPLAVASWFAYNGKLPVKGTWAEWIGHPAAVASFSAAAMGEYVADKLPNTPNRTDTGALIGRLAFGGLVGAIVATAFKRPIAGGAALGALGAAAGTYGGFYLRKGLTKGAGLPDLPVAITGDSAAVALAVRSMRRLIAANG